MQDSRQVDPPQRSFGRSVPPKRLSYLTLMTELINSEPSSFGEVAQHDVSQEAMVEEYDSIMKNQVWEVVPRPQGKKVVGSNCIYTVKHGAEEIVEKNNVASWQRGFHKTRVLTIRRPSPLSPGTLPFEP